VIRTVRLVTPLSEAAVLDLRAGDAVLLTGTIHTAREEAHEKLLALADSGMETPFPLDGAVIYYVGPSPMTPDRPIGAAGPSSASRMDPYAAKLHALGARASIGKGRRSPAVLESLKEHRAVYLGATGGAGALLSMHIRRCRVAAFPELGPEAVHALDVENFPLTVLCDCHGGDLHAVPDLDAALCVLARGS